MNAVEREPVETRVLNPTASEASYKPKRSYRKTNPKKKFWCRMVPAPKCPAPKCPAPKRRRQIGRAESAAPKRTRPLFGWQHSKFGIPSSLFGMSSSLKTLAHVFIPRFLRLPSQSLACHHHYFENQSSRVSRVCDEVIIRC